MPEHVKRFTVALKEDGLSVVVLASDYEKAVTQRDEELRERLEAKFGGGNLQRALSIFEEDDDAA